MVEKDMCPVHLHRIDPSLNMRRFYALALQPTLFGGVSVIRHWGRIGSKGRSLIQTFDDCDDAIAAMDAIEKSKRRRGYRTA